MKTIASRDNPAYKALHPSLRTPVLLLRLRTDWVGPTVRPMPTPSSR